MKKAFKQRLWASESKFLSEISIKARGSWVDFRNIQQVSRYWYKLNTSAVECKNFHFRYIVFNNLDKTDTIFAESIHADKPERKWLLSGETDQVFTPTLYIYTDTYKHIKILMYIVLLIGTSAYMVVEYIRTDTPLRIYIYIYLTRIEERSWKAGYQSEVSRKICIQSKNLMLSNLPSGC